MLTGGGGPAPVQNKTRRAFLKEERMFLYSLFHKTLPRSRKVNALDLGKVL